MRFGIFCLPLLRPGISALEIYENIITEACLVDEWGWDNIWMSEHHFDSYGGVIPSPIQLGTAIAMKTKRIRIGTAITILPFHLAFQLAEGFSMLDVLSDGRVEIGVGRGFLPHELESFSISEHDRQTKFEEGLEVLRLAWNGERFSYDGEHNKLKNVQLLPTPIQKQPPIWVAASLNPASFQLAGQNGFHLMINPYTRTEEEIRRGISWYQQALEKSGYDPRNARILAHFHLYVAPSEEQAYEEPREALLSYMSEVDRAYLKGGGIHNSEIAPHSYDEIYPSKVMFGTPEIIEERIRTYQSLGITDFCFMTQFGDLSFHRTIASLRLFTEKVIPKFR
ncbi:LLM class flavin-dependent oxidoreductase [Thermoactinomyces sp. DSM 45892]|uniref:LLM class flavin-dependent oxidoreductase n=1 Tax=Thermoactinomyces sp. DSM 45892 TaxID=1882753 RepID=UPI00089C8119|nr:LLM class flavin-dependent oxidoreductase [Thermoactinomyces sp. DSM 45892]SDY10938.1 natural product biosynthesis luciferase-like monooxygenase domain-containing protein [Thermoactinomyces sp. DSM 45892]